MDEIVTFERLLWGFIVFLNGVLLVRLLYRKNHRIFPFFFAYALCSLLQNLLLIESYRIWPFNSPVTHLTSSGTQGVVIAGRGLAAAAMCHRLPARCLGLSVMDV